MKNLISLSTLAFLLVFTSCLQEDRFEVEPVSPTRKQANVGAMHSAANDINEEKASSNSTYSIEASEIASFISATEYSIDFSTTGFNGGALEATQQLDFEDSAGNTTTLSFQVNSASYANDLLEVNLAIGTNNLTGLLLKKKQDIIIQDTVIN